ncbi:MAG TPA: SMP-30/gluconolactonase/LRE family protein [Cyclobacteriaceae bacterium]|nr:SMP-30/gluconolactonase/LRE family protein [Cyclobacteriaceae bacterium]
MKKIQIILPILCIWMYSTLLVAQTNIVRKDPALDAIVDVHTEIVKVADGFQFTEGPVWNRQGYLLFSDIPANKIYKWDPQEGVSVLAGNSGASNGLAFNSRGELYICQHADRRVAKMNQAGGFETITDHYKGKKLNSPNDLVIKSDGSVYFTDPPWGLPKGMDDPSREIPYQGVYRFLNGTTILIDSTLEMPNGIAFSPDERILYVANFSPKTNAKYWVSYRLNKKGTAKLSKRNIFADATESLERGGPDGMKVDRLGNVYCSGPGGVLIYGPDGTYLGLIRFPELVANLCFGGSEGKTLFVTARTGVYSVELKVRALK